MLLVLVFRAVLWRLCDLLVQEPLQLLDSMASSEAVGIEAPDAYSLSV